ncbi:MAG: molybdenum cofactor guanylyltransferase [Bacteroidia bacterium]|nr:molybdenum cofactor guanylyltransferase [Bacteroidia bacterium]
MKITAAILAGGPASRMKGVIKPKIILDGKTILERSLFVLKNIFSEIILVTNSPELFSEYDELLITSDHIKGIGPMAGIHAALKAASGDAVFIFAGDMPLLNNDLMLEDYISTAESMSVRDFCLSVNVKYMDIEKDINGNFFNVNSHSDITEVERIIKTGGHKTL